MIEVIILTNIIHNQCSIFLFCFSICFSCSSIYSPLYSPIRISLNNGNSARCELAAFASCSDEESIKMVMDSLKNLHAQSRVLFCSIHIVHFSHPFPTLKMPNRLFNSFTPITRQWYIQECLLLF